MSDASLVAQALGRDWVFRITVGQWMKLQLAFGKIGPLEISERLGGTKWTIEDVREVIERGLEGGGMAAAEARTAATEIIDSSSLDKSYALAGDIIGAAWAGMDELMKKKAAIEKVQTLVSKIQMANGGSATSSVPDFFADSSLPKSSSSASGNISP